MSKIQKVTLIILPIIVIIFFGAFKYFQNQAEIKRYDFTITTDKGEVKLSDFRGKKTLVYFGYGLCPDICPTTLMSVAEALNKLSPNEAQKVGAIFITLDPQRDDVKKLGSFVRYFYPSIIGGSASLEDTQKYAENYGVKYKKVLEPNSSIGYSIAHSADLYLIDENGKLIAVFPFGATSDDIVTAIKK